MTAENEQSTNTIKHRRSCHCGAVRFEVALEPIFAASRCNCSVCTKTAVSSTFAKPEAFTLLTPETELGDYVWGGKISRRYFCKQCGVHCFAHGHLAELGGDYVSINANSLDDFDPNTLTIQYWDGRHNNWEGGPRATPWPIHAQVEARGSARAMK